MASVKNLKSKGRARTIDYHPDVGARSISPLYDLRKQQFADLPPAVFVRPLRALKKRAAEAFSAYFKAVQLVDGNVTSPLVADARADLRWYDYVRRYAERAAKLGQGRVVVRTAQAHA